MTRVDVPARELWGASEAPVRVFRERLSCRGIPPRPREPKVDQMEPPCVFPSAEDEVAWFDVAVDDALRVDVLEDVQLRAVTVSVRRLFGLMHDEEAAAHHLTYEDDEVALGELGRPYLLDGLLEVRSQAFHHEVFEVLRPPPRDDLGYARVF